MKKLFTLVALFYSLCSSAQWSNTTNQFYDSLLMPVAAAPTSQRSPLVLPSFPDGGYFVIWEDDRNYGTTKTDIYAQKYDSTGHRLWAENGVPVTTGSNDQHYTFSSIQDYRNRSFAATDGAGGFYLCYADDSIATYTYQRMIVQHMKSNGAMVFPGLGYIVAATTFSDNYSYSWPLLVPDGNGGFFISYSRNTTGANRIYVLCYKDEGGAMKFYGGGVVNENGVVRYAEGPCGVASYIEHVGGTVNDYAIWPDGQGGCNVVMSLYGGEAGGRSMLAYNKIFRVKKKSVVKYLRRNNSGYACPQMEQFDSGKVYVQYIEQSDDLIQTCIGADGHTAYVKHMERILSPGYLLLDIDGFEFLYPKGITLSADSTLRANVMAITTRKLFGNQLTDYFVKVYSYPDEIYDSIPYQRSSYKNPDYGYNTKPPSKMSKLDFYRDTILGTGIYSSDFSLAGGGSDVYAASLIGNGGPRNVRLQHLQLEKKGAGSYALSIKTNTKLGVPIGKEISTGNTENSIFYDNPLVTADATGQGIFYIKNFYGSTQISPIMNGTELAWGAMGRRVATSVFSSHFYNLDQPTLSLHSLNGTGLLAFRENRFTSGSTGDNISMRHIDSVKVAGYKPPYKPVLVIPNPFGGSQAQPAALTGSSKTYSLIEIYQSNNTAFLIATPFVEILDNFNFGAVQSYLFQNSGAVRRYNGKAYLDRNFLITPENDPGGKAVINVRLFFTKAEFDVLKSADASIKTPGDLLVVQQPLTYGIPGAYTPVAGEQALFPAAWKAVDSGYYVETRTTALGNFFLLKGEAVQLCPGGSATVVSNLSGSSYQWQGGYNNNFSNLSNDMNYGSTNTNTLKLTNMPSAYAGLQFRCVVDGVPGNVTISHFSNTWTGAVNNDWNTAGNWSCGSVPDQYTDVVINSGSIIIKSNVACRTLTINPSVSITVSTGHSLKIMF